MKQLLYVLVLIGTMLNYVIRRGMGIIAVPMSAAMGISPGSFMIFASILEWTKSVSVAFSTFLDKSPLKTFIAGIVIYIIGLIGMAAFMSSYYAMFVMVAIMAVGHMCLVLSMINFMSRSKGYGTTYDTLPIGIAITCAPFLTFLFFGGGVTSISITTLFLVYLGLCLVVFTAIAWIMHKNVDYRPTPKAPVNIFKYWNTPGMLTFILLSASTSTMVYFVNANFLFLLLSLGVDKVTGTLWFVSLWAGVGLLGRVFWSWWGRYYSHKWLFINALAIIIMGLLVLPYSFTTFIIGTALMAFGTGCGQSVMPVWMADRMGRDTIMSTWGFNSMVYTAISGVIIFLSGIFLNMTGNNYILMYQLYALFQLITIFKILSEKNVVYVDQLNGKGTYKDFKESVKKLVGKVV